MLAYVRERMQNHTVDFSPLCVFICLLKSSSWIDAKSHWLHLFSLSRLCEFKCVLKLLLNRRMHNHTGCICFPFLWCGFPNVSSNGLCKRMQSYIGCTYVTSQSDSYESIQGLSGIAAADTHHFSV